MKVFHLQFETDAETKAALTAVDKLDGVLESSSHHAFGHGPAYIVVVTQDSFDPALFRREYSLVYEEKAAEQIPEPEMEIFEANDPILDYPKEDEELPEAAPVED